VYSYSSFLQISWGHTPQLILVFGRSHFDLLITSLLELLGTPLHNIYTWKFNFGRSIWDKNAVLLETAWECDGNLLATYWEQEKKSLKIIKIWNMYKIGLGSGSSSSYRGWFLGLVCPFLFFKIQNQRSRDWLKNWTQNRSKNQNLTILIQTQHDQCDVMDIKQIIMT